MAESEIDVLSVMKRSEFEEHRRNQMMIILSCLQTLKEHIDSLQYGNCKTAGVLSETSVDVDLIQYQLWLSSASQRITELLREMNWKKDGLSSLEGFQTEVKHKCILDESIDADLDAPIAPDPVWIKEALRVNEFKNQIEKDDFQKRVKQLRMKLIRTEKECPAFPKYNEGRANSVQRNLKSMNENLIGLKKLVDRLETKMKVLPTKYVAITDWYMNEVDLLRKLTESMKLQLSSKNEEIITLKNLVNYNREETHAKIQRMQSQHENFRKQIAGFDEHKKKVLKEMKEAADDVCDLMKIWDVCAVNKGRIEETTVHYTEEEKQQLRNIIDQAATENANLKRHLETLVGDRLYPTN